MAREKSSSPPEQDFPSRVALLREPDPFLVKGAENPPPFLGDSDLEVSEEPQFLRAQKRVPVRKSSVTRRTAGRIKIAFIVVGTAGVCLAIATGLYAYGTQSWRFRIESGDNIEIGGLHNVPRSQTMEILGGDIGRNIFFVKLDDQKRHLEEIPWIESATVMRLLPNRIAVQVQERTPVAFARIGSKIQLIDGRGIVMDMPRAASRYSFPVLTGMSEAEPLSMRAARMKLYSGFVKELDSEGGNSSRDLSEVDLSDPDDVRVTLSDSAGAVLVHFGSANFLERYKLYMAHVQEWRQQFPKLESVDLRYDRQIIVNPDAAPDPKSDSKSDVTSDVKPAVKSNVKSGAKPNARPNTRIRQNLKTKAKYNTNPNRRAAPRAHP